MTGWLGGTSRTTFLKRIYDRAFDADVFSHSAQVAFYFSFALFPLQLESTGPLVAQLQLSNEREEDVRLLFKNANKDPKILIVTDKLLTGYDAPVGQAHA